MTTEQNAIWSFLTLNAVGIQNAVKIESIATGIGEPPQGTNNDNVRNWINKWLLTIISLLGRVKMEFF